MLAGCFSAGLFAQNIDDTVTVVHSPKKAAIMSACLPGLGQVYNRKYWKVPVVYAGLGASVYAISFNRSKYLDYRQAYISRTDGDPATTDPFEGYYSESNLLDLRNYYRHNLELSVIITSFIYILNIVDASVDAHLFDFDISDDLSFSLSTPPQSGSFSAPPSCGFTLRLTF